MDESSAVTTPITTRVGTKTVCSFPVVGCLLAAERFVGADRTWNGTNDLQRCFIRSVFQRGRKDVSKFSDEELRMIASFEVDKINKFLREGGFSIQLSPFPENTFGVASILKVDIEWKETGEETQVNNSKGTFPAVSLDTGVSALKSKSYRNPIACLKSKTGDQLFMTIADEPCEGLDLLDKVNAMGSLEPCYDFEGVVFPMIDYDQEVDISWLIGLQTFDEAQKPWAIADAKQRTKFKMNEQGAITESAAVMSMELLGLPSPPITIDQPFFLWKTRPGVQQPIFAAYLEEDCWKNPGKLF